MFLTYNLILSLIIGVYSDSIKTPKSHLGQYVNSDLCSSHDCPGKTEYDSIKFLHSQLDDDSNGDIDVSETAEFLRDELQYENGNDRKKGFHRHDKHISLSELWQSWRLSEVHNWTVQDTLSWLTTAVELPQYCKTFEEHNVNGTILPILATNNAQFINNVLGIKDTRHRQKIVLKAMDAVLFGPSKDRNFMKDAILVLLLLIAIGGCWFAYVQHQYSQRHLKKMMADMEALQKAEDSLMDMQQELDKARQEQANATHEKKKLEKRLKSENSIDCLEIYSENESNVKIKLLQEQVDNLQSELDQREELLELCQSQWIPTPPLQLWLQLTYEIEMKNYTMKKNAAEHQLKAAKEACDKLRKKRTQMFGSFRIAHGSSIDDIDHKIFEAKTALTEVTQDFKERLQRWQQIELLCGVPIFQNPGISYLRSFLSGSLDSRAKFLNTTRALLNKKESSEALLDEELTPSAVQRLVSMSAKTFLAPVPPQGVKCAAPFPKRGNGLLNKPAILKKSRSTNQIKTNGSLPRELTFPKSLHASSSLNTSPTDPQTASDIHSSNAHLSRKVAAVDHVTENNSSDDSSSNIIAEVSSSCTYSLCSNADQSESKNQIVNSHVNESTKAPTKLAEVRSPNSRQSSTDSFNALVSSHENSVSPPRSYPSKKNKFSLFRNKSGSNGNLVSPSSPEDCSTDSGSVNEEIKHKKKRMFLHLKKSKPKTCESNK